MALKHSLNTQVHSKEQPLKVILESQYRPTQGNHVIEVCSITPAGRKIPASLILENSISLCLSAVDADA